MSEKSFTDEVAIFHEQVIKFREVLKAFTDKAFRVSAEAQIVLPRILQELYEAEASVSQGEREKNADSNFDSLPLFQDKDFYQLDPLLKSIEKTLEQLESDKNT